MFFANPEDESFQRMPSIALSHTISLIEPKPIIINEFEEETKLQKGFNFFANSATSHRGGFLVDLGREMEIEEGALEPQSSLRS